MSNLSEYWAAIKPKQARINEPQIVKKIKSHIFLILKSTKNEKKIIQLIAMITLLATAAKIIASVISDADKGAIIVWANSRGQETEQGCFCSHLLFDR